MNTTGWRPLLALAMVLGLVAASAVTAQQAGNVLSVRNTEAAPRAAGGHCARRTLQRGQPDGAGVHPDLGDQSLHGARQSGGDGGHGRRARALPPRADPRMRRRLDAGGLQLRSGRRGHPAAHAGRGS